MVLHGHLFGHRRFVILLLPIGHNKSGEPIELPFSDKVCIDSPNDRVMCHDENASSLVFGFKDHWFQLMNQIYVTLNVSTPQRLDTDIVTFQAYVPVRLADTVWQPTRR